MPGPLPETDETPQEGSPHSLRYIAIRLLAALAVAGAFFAVDELWIEDDPLRDQFGASVKTYEIESDVLGRTMPVKVVVPAKAPPRDRDLLVFLHGRGEDERSYLEDPMFEGLAAQSGRAPVIAFPFGGDSSYWHDRDSGEWARYVLDEVIPEIVVRFDIDPDRIAIGGISMGGYGAYNLAASDPGRFCAVGGHSPAIWESPGDTAPGAFDDEEDFESNDVIAAARRIPSPYADTRLWIDAGEDDPFLAGDDVLEEALRANGARPVVKRSPGGHDSGYWNDNWSEYFQFYAHALNECEIGDEEEAAAAKRDDEGVSPPSDRPDPSSREAGSGEASGAQQP